MTHDRTQVEPRTKGGPAAGRNAKGGPGKEVHGTTDPRGSGAKTKKPVHGGHILLAEDDTEFRSFLEGALRREGYQVTACTHGINLLGHLSGHARKGPPEHFDLVISDIRMPGVSGLEALQEMEPRGKMPPTILITAFGDQATHMKAEEAGAVAVLDKPFEMERLLRAVHKILG